MAGRMCWVVRKALYLLLLGTCGNTCVNGPAPGQDRPPGGLAERALRRRTYVNRAGWASWAGSEALKTVGETVSMRVTTAPKRVSRGATGGG